MNARTTVKLNQGFRPMVFELDIDNPPDPLTLLINPNTLDWKRTPKITEQRTRWASGASPYSFHVHHDELDVISASGRSAMFMSDNGLERNNRTQTLGYKNLENLVYIYRLNGMNLNSKVGSVGKPCMIDSIGRVVLTYDGFVYRGHFISFSTTENDQYPFNIDFSFEFKVTQTIDTGLTAYNQIAKNISLKV